MASKPTQSLTTLRKKRDTKHLFRFLQHQSGKTIEEIAKSEKVNPSEIQKSIEDLLVYQEQNTQLRLELAMRDMIIQSIPEAQEALNGLLKATTIVSVKDQNTGQIKDIEVPDKVTRLEGVRMVKDFFSSTLPKTPGVAVQVNNGQQGASTMVGRAETNEERMRRIRAKQMEHNLL